MTGIEISILLWVQENLRGAMDGLWVFITKLGDEGFLWIAIGVLLLLFKKTRWVGATVLTALLINLVMTNLTLKDLFARPRPFSICEELVTLVPQPSSFSFPSGHTSCSFTAALVLYKMLPKKFGVPAVVLASLIGLSRIYIGVHFPTDVLGGIVVGIIASTLAYHLIQWIRNKIGAKKEHVQK